MSQGMLLERAPELALIDQLLAQTGKGSGATVIVQGPAGIGKTTVLVELARVARDKQFRVLMARPGPLEHDLAWSVSRDLFGRALMALSESKREQVLSGAARLARLPLGIPYGHAGEGQRRSDEGKGRRPARAPDMAAPMYGIYWACSNLAQLAPLLVVVDDAHWADPPSARFLAYLSERASDLPLLIALGVRTGEMKGPLTSVAQKAHLIEPAPLSSGAGAQVVRRRAGSWAGDELCQACHEATGGNPFLLEELAGEIARRGPSVQPGEVAGLRPATVTRTVLLRLARLPAQARKLAIVATVLGHGDTLSDAAALLHLSRQDAALAHDLLVEAGILRAGEQLELVHPLVGEVIYGESPPAQRSELHLAAARLHHLVGRPPEDVAAQLLGTMPGRDPWVVAQLQQAARVALGRAAPQVASAYLRRALSEGAGPPEVDVLVSLGIAEAAAHLPGAVEHLLEAHARAATAFERADVVLVAAPLLVLDGRLAEVAQLCDDALAEIGEQDAERKLRLVAALLSAALLDRELYPGAARALATLGPVPDGTTAGQRVALAVVARVQLGDGQSRPGPVDGPLMPPRSAVASAEMARRSLGGGLLLAEVGPENPLYWYASTALMFPGWYDECAEAIEAGLAEARRRGSVLGFTLASCFRSQLRYRQGRLIDSVADARTAVEIGGHEVSAVLRAYATAFLVTSLVDSGAEDEARAVLSAGPQPGPAPEVFAFALVKVSAARLALVSGDLAGGAAALLETGAVIDAHGGPAVTPWRAPAAIALAALGRTAQAQALVAQDRELALASESGWALSISLRASGIVADDIGLVAEAVTVAQQAGARLEEVRALCDLGAMHRRAGARRTARHFLELAAEGAEECQALLVARRANEELAICGGPKGAYRRSPLGLTPSEQRVADMALTGMTNPEMAQALFVSLRTVETHLTHIYRKLGIQSRRQLWQALGGTERAGRSSVPMA